jgi:hypothetical protein
MYGVLGIMSSRVPGTRANQAAADGADLALLLMSPALFE